MFAKNAKKSPELFHSGLLFARAPKGNQAGNARGEVDHCHEETDPGVAYAKSCSGVEVSGRLPESETARDMSAAAA